MSFHNNQATDGGTREKIVKIKNKMEFVVFLERFPVNSAKPKPFPGVIG